MTTRTYSPVLEPLSTSLGSPEYLPAIAATSVIPQQIIQEWRLKLVNSTRAYDRLQLVGALADSRNVSVLSTLLRLLPTADWQLLQFTRKSIVLNFERESYVYIAERLVRQDHDRNKILHLVNLGQFETDWGRLAHPKLIEVLAILLVTSESDSLRSDCFKLAMESFSRQQRQGEKESGEQSFVEYLVTLCHPDSACLHQVIDELLAWSDWKKAFLHRSNIKSALRQIAANIGTDEFERALESDSPSKRKRAIHFLGLLAGSRHQETLIRHYCLAEKSEKGVIEKILQKNFSTTYSQAANQMADRNPDLLRYLSPLIKS